jgi:hypothetical protein
MDATTTLINIQLYCHERLLRADCINEEDLEADWEER